MPTMVVPLTVAPAAGFVNAAVGVAGVEGGGVVVPLRVVTLTVAWPPFPAPSPTATVTRRTPSATFRVSHVKLTVLTELALVATVAPSTSRL
jgi:hypothetical protein